MSAGLTWALRREAGRLYLQVWRGEESCRIPFPPDLESDIVQHMRLPADEAAAGAAELMRRVERLAHKSIPEENNGTL